ncbi:MAG: right-handed parallel beta-helix repeat-containing protein [Bacteroidales bacterium]|nr:right-handed parallel beta-helix repeat-containing protein [Bacteroidales bacterium]
MKPLIRLSSFFALMVCATFMNASIAQNIPANRSLVHVPDDFASIQEAISAVTDGDTILVYPGTYVENPDFSGKTIVLGSLYLTTGDASYIEETIIDGDEISTVVNMSSGEGPGTLITGFTIRDGYVEGNPMHGGAGIRCVDASPTISHNSIRNNSTYWYIPGGGIYCKNSTPTISHNTIKYNSGAYEGSGIYMEDCTDAVVERNVIFGNTTMSGYGVSYGAGIRCTGNMVNTLIINNTLSGNEVDFGWGGGISIATNQEVIVKNCISYGNEPDELHEESGTLAVTYSDIEGGWEGTGNINQDPLFANPGAGDYSLMEDSPCIDAGDPDSPIDPDGTRADMGAIYFNQIITQECSLDEGFQFVSTRVVCNNPDMMAMVQALINNQTLDFVRNSNGNMLRKIGGEWINNIGEWNTLEGYLFKMLEDDNLCITGIPVNPQTPVALEQGYQFISYLPDESIDAFEVFSGLLEVLDFVRDSEGNMLRKIGPEWINNIGHMQPGQGYLVKMNEAGELVYPG